MQWLRSKQAKSAGVAVVILVALQARSWLRLDWIKFGQCKVYQLTGLSCPGCGTTRMIEALTHFEIYQAFRYNPGLFILVVLSPIGLMIWMVLRQQNKSWKVSSASIEKTSRVIGYILLTSLVIYGVARNLPGLSWLLPTTM